MRVEEFFQHIKIGIKTKGYHMIPGVHNLLPCISFIGKLSNHSSTKYKLRTDQALKALGTKGIQVIEAKRLSSETLAGLEWKITELIPRQQIVPSRNSFYTSSTGEVNLRFSDYTSVGRSQDEDSIHLEFANRAYEKPHFTLDKLEKFSESDIIRLKELLEPVYKPNLKYYDYQILEGYYCQKLEFDHPELDTSYKSQRKYLLEESIFILEEKFLDYDPIKNNNLSVEDMFCHSDPRSRYYNHP